MNAQYDACLDKLCEQDGVKGALVLDSLGLCVSRRGVARLSDVEPILKAETAARAAQTEGQTQDVLAFRHFDHIILLERFPKLVIIVYKHPDESG
ncbi:hypothetical protein FVE85_7601 [Porphyridium purpureum]|uniref:Late endosomal/lysosomal adaptor and MAPK and MTOR activator 5 n=1 Tax=Porphyridium purpureum TaxID=35688 RepID=A0A5J4Z8C5_PORPP|nr:hypothetical protein FVE85_7601 [Porphyridium purpureum]|eukprot:POR0160..scf295_1